MAQVICEYCGAEFFAVSSKRKICGDCLMELYKSTKEKPKKSKANQKLLEEVREATAHNMSYGQWKGRQS